MNISAIATVLASAVVGLIGLVHAVRSSRGALAHTATEPWGATSVVRLLGALALTWLIGDRLQQVAGDSGWVLAVLLAYLLMRAATDAEGFGGAPAGRG